MAKQFVGRYAETGMGTLMDGRLGAIFTSQPSLLWLLPCCCLLQILNYPLHDFLFR
jgi:hypothetical protein